MQGRAPGYRRRGTEKVLFLGCHLYPPDEVVLSGNFHHTNVSVPSGVPVLSSGSHGL